MDKAREDSSSKGLQRLINLILQRFVLSRKEAHEALVIVKEKNGGVLKGLKLKRFYKMVEKVNREKNLKELQKKKDQKQKWKETCHYCYKIFYDNQARDRHMENAHSEPFIEEEIETGTIQRKVEERDNEVEGIMGIASLLLEEILDKVVKKSKRIKLGEKCPECDNIFSHEISMKRHLKHHAKDLKYFQCDECDFKTLRRDNLTKHRRNKHKAFNTNFDVLRDKDSNLNYTCRMCEEEFPDSDLFETHIVMKACHNPTDPLNDDGRYQCELCPSSYTIKWDLSRHMEWKHKPKQVFSCDVCNKTFYNQYSLKRHVKKLHMSEC